MDAYSHFKVESHIVMATKIIQDVFDGELEKESESKDCQFPALSQVYSLLRAFSLWIGLSNRWNVTF